MPVKILIVDDHETLREGIRSILKRARPQWEICGEASSGLEAIDATKRLRPDIILLDITMPQMSGLEAAPRIVAVGSNARILIFTMHESDELAHDARRVGASGYLSKSDASRQLVLAIETLLSGGTFFGQPQAAPSAPKNTQGGPTISIVLRVALSLSYSLVCFDRSTAIPGSPLGFLTAI
jgi:DNA-binding NarL/FixJ family response regulator